MQNYRLHLLICKEKDRIQAQYALESSSQPLGISEYELEKFYPEKLEGTIPTIKEIEEKLKDFPRCVQPHGDWNRCTVAENVRLKSKN